MESLCYNSVYSTLSIGYTFSAHLYARCERARARARKLKLVIAGQAVRLEVGPRRRDWRRACFAFVVRNQMAMTPSLVLARSCLLCLLVLACRVLSWAVLVVLSLVEVRVCPLLPGSLSNPPTEACE